LKPLLVNLGEQLSRLIPSITPDERKFISGLVPDIRTWTVVRDASAGEAKFSGTSPSGISVNIQLKDQPNNVRKYRLDVSSAASRPIRMPISVTVDSTENRGDVLFLETLIAAAVQKSSNNTP
jgi:hypothetical protein